MKTKDLIRELMKADPSGELEVTVGKTDILGVQMLPCYWDGFTQILKRDTSKSGYNIIGAEVRSDGQHICIDTMDIRTMLWTTPEAPVTIDSDAEADYGPLVDFWRREAQEKEIEDE